MTARKPVTVPMRVGDVARLLDVTIPTIHHWQLKFPMPVLRRNGQRLFPQAAINRLHLIKHLTHTQRYTLHGARQRYDELLSLDW